jgi:hypothetical protein
MSAPKGPEDGLDMAVARYVPLEECPGFTAAEVAEYQPEKFMRLDTVVWCAAPALALALVV